MKSKQTTVGWWMEQARINDSLLLTEVNQISAEVQDLLEEVTGIKARKEAEYRKFLHGMQNLTRAISSIVTKTIR